jgi:hypothetical protein
MEAASRLRRSNKEVAELVRRWDSWFVRRKAVFYIGIGNAPAKLPIADLVV